MVRGDFATTLKTRVYKRKAARPATTAKAPALETEAPTAALDEVSLEEFDLFFCRISMLLPTTAKSSSTEISWDSVSPLRMEEEAKKEATTCWICIVICACVWGC